MSEQVNRAVDLTTLDLATVIAYLLRLYQQPWMRMVDIIPRYMPPHPRERCAYCVAAVPTLPGRFGFCGDPIHRFPDGREENCHGPETKPIVAIRCGEWFLRHSKGPDASTFWDVYGDDFMAPELALVALSQAPAPPVIWGRKPYLQFKLPLKGVS